MDMLPLLNTEDCKVAEVVEVVESSCPVNTSKDPTCSQANLLFIRHHS